MEYNQIIQGDSLSVLKTLPDESVNCCVTSPPYWGLRDYGIEGQLGLEKTYKEYITKLCVIFDHVRRVLKEDGTCWVNLGDSYGGTGTGQEKSPNKYKETDGQYYEQANARNIKNASTKGVYDKCLMLIPQRFAIEMVGRGWILRNTIIWHKPNCMPSSANDRFTVDFEYLFFFVKSKKYWFEQQFEKMADVTLNDKRVGNDNKGFGWKDYKKEGVSGGIEVRQRIFNNLNPQGRNKRCVWEISTKSFKEAHFAVYPEALIETPIQAGCPKGGIVLDPFIGAGTTAVVAKKQGKRYLGIELKQEYIDMANKRIRRIPELLF